MILRLALSSGLVLLGYYIGREVGRTEPIRREMREFREQRRGRDRGTKHP